VVVAAVRGQLDRPGRQGRGVYEIVAAEGRDPERVEGDLRVRDVHLRHEPDHRDLARVAEDLYGVVAGASVHEDRVLHEIAGAVRAGEVHVHLEQVGRREVAQEDQVASAARDQIDGFDGVEVEHDAGDAPGHPHPPEHRRELEGLVGARAVEEQRVEARASDDRVEVVARVPDEGVVAAAHLGELVAVAAVELVVPFAADQLVVAEAADEDEADRAGREPARVDEVRFPERIQGQPVVSRFRADDLHVRGQAESRDEGRIADDAEGVDAVGAGREDRVGLGVAESARAPEIDADLLHVGSAEIAHVDGVGAAVRAVVDRLDVVEVGRDVVGVAEEVHARAVRVDVHELGLVVAVEAERVEAALSLDGVEAAEIAPDEGVVAVAEQRHVVAGPAVDLVVAGAAEQHVRPLAAEQQGVGKRPAALVELEEVGAPVSAHLDAQRVPDGRRAAADRNLAAVHHDRSCGDAHLEEVGASGSDDAEDARRRRELRAGGGGTSGTREQRETEAQVGAEAKRIRTHDETPWCRCTRTLVGPRVTAFTEPLLSSYAGVSTRGRFQETRASSSGVASHTSAPPSTRGAPGKSRRTTPPGGSATPARPTPKPASVTSSPSTGWCPTIAMRERPRPQLASSRRIAAALAPPSRSSAVSGSGPPS